MRLPLHLSPVALQVCFFWFGFALLMWISLFTITFQRMVSVLR